MSNTLALAIVAKDEGHCIGHCIESVIDYIDEIIIIDTGSTDNTAEVVKNIALKYNKETRIYNVGYPEYARDFWTCGEVKNLSIHLPRTDWVLTLDADETLENPEKLKPLLFNSDMFAFKLPRRRWKDLEKKEELEKENYPDFQVRLFKNNRMANWVGYNHESVQGIPKEYLGELTDVCINHFHDSFKDEKKQEIRRSKFILSGIVKAYENSTYENIIKSIDSLSPICDEVIIDGFEMSENLIKDIKIFTKKKPKIALMTHKVFSGHFIPTTGNWKLWLLAGDVIPREKYDYVRQEMYKRIRDGLAKSDLPLKEINKVLVYNR